MAYLQEAAMPAPVVLDVDTKGVIAALREFSAKDAPFMMAYALTQTGKDVKAAEYAAMQEAFDRPTRYTLNALQLTPATKTELTATVDYKYFGGTPADRYLGPQVDGGPRTHKSTEKALISAGLMGEGEFLVPGAGVQLDAFGNVPGRTYTRILSQLRASRDPTQNMTDKSRKRAIRSAKGQYFVMRGGRAAPGIYQRTEQGIMPVLMFVRAPEYKPRFAFYEIARQVFDNQLLPRAREAWEKYVKPKLA